MLFQINATLFSGIEKFYSAKVQKKDKTKKKTTSTWKMRKVNVFGILTLKCTRKMHVIWIYLVSFLVSYPRGISPP